MKLVFRYDNEGKYMEDVRLKEGQAIPFDCTEKELPQPNWKPIFMGNNWVETATEEEKYPPIIIEKTLEERVLELEEKLNK